VFNAEIKSYILAINQVYNEFESDSSNNDFYAFLSNRCRNSINRDLDSIFTGHTQINSYYAEVGSECIEFDLDSSKRIYIIPAESYESIVIHFRNEELESYH
jgi:hypothetical protein